MGYSHPAAPLPGPSEIALYGDFPFWTLRNSSDLGGAQNGLNGDLPPGFHGGSAGL